MQFHETTQSNLEVWPHNIYRLAKCRHVNFQVTIIHTISSQVAAAEADNISTAISARESIVSSSVRSSEGVGPDIDEKEEEEHGAASGGQAQSSHNSSDVWDIPGDPWATRGDGLVMFCPRNTK